MTALQKMTLPTLLVTMNELSTELYPYDFDEEQKMQIAINIYEWFVEDSTKAIAEIREQTEQIMAENEDSELIVELSQNVLAQLDYMERI